MRNGNSLHGRTILIVQQNWMTATALATAFEARGAQALLAKNSLPDLANVPGLAAAVLGSHSRDLCQQLQAREVPFVLYSGQMEVDHECSALAIIQKPAPPAEIVARLEQLLS
jgi:DNA-binding response OmpR family regulator